MSKNHDETDYLLGTQANAEHIKRSMAQAEAGQVQQHDLIMVDDIDQFVQTMEAWHAANINQLKTMQLIPEDGYMEVEGPDGAKYRMEGDFAKGYKIALITALSIFMNLPFGEVPEDEPANGPTD